MWYLLHQQADEMLAERHREAARRRLLNEIASGSGPDRRTNGRAVLTAIRASSARLVHAASHGAERLALALDPSIEDAVVGDPSR